MTSELNRCTSWPNRCPYEKDTTPLLRKMTQCYNKSLLLAAALVGCLSYSVAFQVVSPLAVKSSSPSACRPLSTKLFMAQKMTPTRKTRREDSFDREDSEDGSNEKAEDIIFDYSEAQSKMKEEENKRRVEEGLTVGLTKEVRFFVICWQKSYFIVCSIRIYSHLLYICILGRRRIQRQEGCIRGHESKNQSAGIAGGI